MKVETCRSHVDRPAAIVFEKGGSGFGWCADCARRQKEGTMRGLVIGHGYIARRPVRLPVPQPVARS